MATQLLYFQGAVFGTGVHWPIMHPNDSVGSETYLSGPVGWIGGTGSTNRSKFAAGAERASTTFDATTYPNGTPDTTLLDCQVLTLNGGVPPQTGRYDAGNWVFYLCVRAQTNPGCSGKVHLRMFKSVNQNGSNWSEVTSGDQAGTTVSSLATTVTQDSVVTFNPGAVTLNNEYLFIQLAWERTGGGSMTTSDVDIRVGNNSGHGSRLTTPNFTATTIIEADANTDGTSTASANSGATAKVDANTTGTSTAQADGVDANPIRATDANSAGTSTAAADSSAIWSVLHVAEAIFPSSITGLKVRWAASSLALNDDDAVNSWPDLTETNGLSPSGNGGGVAPTFKTNIINGKPVVRFDGATQGLSSWLENTTAQGPVTVFVVFNRSSGYPYGFVGPLHTHGFGNSRPFHLGNNPSGYAQLDSGDGSTPAIGPYILGAFHLLTGIENGASGVLFVDGEQVATTDGLDINGVGQFFMGHASPYGIWWGGDVAEIVIYEGVLSDIDRQTVENYLGVTYGLFGGAFDGTSTVTGHGSVIVETTASAEGSCVAVSDGAVTAQSEASTAGTSTVDGVGEDAAAGGLQQREVTTAGTSDTNIVFGADKAVGVSEAGTSATNVVGSALCPVDASTTATSATTVDSGRIIAASFTVANTCATTINGNAINAKSVTVASTSDTAVAGASRNGTAYGVTCTSDTAVSGSALWLELASTTGTSTTAIDSLARARISVDGSVTGTSATDFISGATAWSEASATGTSTAQGDMENAASPIKEVNADTQGTSTAQANAGATKGAAASTTATGTATADSFTRQRISVDGSVTGTSTAESLGNALRIVSWSSEGSAVAEGTSGAIAGSVGAALGTSVVIAQVSDAAVGSDGQAVGTSTVNANTQKIASVVAVSDGSSTAAANVTAFNSTQGSIAATSVANGESVLVMSFTVTAIGSSVVIANVQFIMASAGAASGLGTADAQPQVTAIVEFAAVGLAVVTGSGISAGQRLLMFADVSDKVTLQFGDVSTNVVFRIQ